MKKSKSRSFILFSKLRGIVAGFILRTFASCRRFHSVAGSLKMAFFKRHIIYFSGDTPLHIKYHYSIKGNVVVDSLKPVEQASNKFKIRPIPEVDIIFKWNKYLTKELILSLKNQSEMLTAIPYQLSRISPFNPDELCFCVRSQQRNNNAESNSIVVDYSNVDSVKAIIDSIPEDVYPMALYSENHIWEEYLHIITPKESEFQSTAFYLIIDIDKLIFGAVSDKLRLVPKSAKIDRIKSSEEQIYQILMSYISQLPESSDAIYVVDLSGAGKSFMEKYVNEIPVEMNLIDSEYGNWGKGNTKIINKSLKDIPLTIMPFINMRNGFIPALNPKPYYQKPFLKKHIKSQISYLLVYVILLAAMLVLSVNSEIFRNNRYISNLQNEIAQLSSSVEKLSGMQKEINSIENTAKSEIDILEIFSILLRNKPGDLYFSSLNMIDSRNITIRGSAQKSASPVEYVKNLRKAQEFKSVELIFISQKGTEAGPYIEYQIEASLND